MRVVSHVAADALETEANSMLDGYKSLHPQVRGMNTVVESRQTGSSFGGGLPTYTIVVALEIDDPTT
jgi:hypothetical protein